MSGSYAHAHGHVAVCECVSEAGIKRDGPQKFYFCSDLTASSMTSTSSLTKSLGMASSLSSIVIASSKKM